MKTLIVILYDKLTHVSREYVDTYQDNMKDETINFLWAEGNYACDCNRSLFMYDDKINYKCSTQNIFILKATIKETGKVLIENELT